MNLLELGALAKECLSIIPNATLKDNEIKMWLEAGISDLERLDINVEDNITDALIRSALMLYVKAHFGNTDIKEKELCQRTYDFQRTELSLSTKYKVVDSNV